MEPCFRGSTSLVEAGCGFITSSMLGAALPHPVWQGSTWSQSWSSFWSPTKQGLYMVATAELTSHSKGDASSLHHAVIAIEKDKVSEDLGAR
jgi:hypothetical protein